MEPVQVLDTPVQPPTPKVRKPLVVEIRGYMPGLPTKTFEVTAAEDALHIRETNTGRRLDAPWKDVIGHMQCVHQPAPTEDGKGTKRCRARRLRLSIVGVVGMPVRTYKVAINQQGVTIVRLRSKQGPMFLPWRCLIGDLYIHETENP